MIIKAVNQNLNALITLSLAVIFTGLTDHALGQGSLTPPGAPAATMKSLAQIEPRTPISSVPYTITNAGSYYLTTNLTASAGNGITISSRDVNLDLNGFTLLGTAGSIGIYVNGSYTNIGIRNGTIRGWNLYGIDAANAGSSSDLVFENLMVLNNGFSSNGRGIVTGPATLRNCTISGNAQHGIEIAGGVISDCVLRGNGSAGISMTNNGLIRNCLAESNGFVGISCFSSVRVMDCMASGNLGGITVGSNSVVTGCVANNNGSSGIAAGIHSTIENCTANNNKFYGIEPNAGSLVTGNLACGNGQGGSTGGIVSISVSTNGSRFEGNLTRENFGYGISCGNNDIVLRNTSGGNTNSNYNPGNGIYFAPIQNPATVTNAWGNISY